MIMAKLRLYYGVVYLAGIIFFSLPLRISGTIQPPAGVTIKAINGSDFIVISWNYQADVTLYRIFFRSFHSTRGNSSISPDEFVGPMPVHCLPDNTTCSYCVSNINRRVSCNKLNSNYQAPLTQSELDFEELVSVKVEPCSDYQPETCESQSGWKNYTIPPGAPSPVKNVSGRALSSKTAEVTWLPPNQTRGTIVLYTVLYKTADSREKGRVFRYGTKGILTGLIANTKYKIWMTASTADKEGEKSNVITIQTYEDECVSGPCQHHSKCHVDGISYKCECTGAWEGTTCSNPKGFAVKKRKCVKAEKENKLSLHVNVTLEYCAAKCRESSNCKSLEYGLGFNSSGTFVSTLYKQGLGQCKLRTVDVTTNELKSCYNDYYEKKPPVSAGSRRVLSNMALFAMLVMTLIQW